MLRKRHPAAGARPGTLLLNPESPPTRMRAVLRRGDQNQVFDCARVDETPLPVPGSEKLWLDVCGLGDGEILQGLAKRFRIPPLAMEDLVNVPQRPKSEIFADQQLIIVHSMRWDAGRVHMDQLGIILSENYVLTFHDHAEHVLQSIRQRLRNLNARLHRKNVDYLAYAVVDACVDGYYPMLEAMGESIEALEQTAMTNPRPEVLAEINRTKSQLLELRRSSWPQREMVQSLALSPSSFIEADTQNYLRDTLDHCMQVADTIDIYRESTSGLINTYMSAVAHRSNEIMKVLTLLTSVFVPPTFLAGIYGMNFSSMPELQWQGAYPIALLAMTLMIIGTLLVFHRCGWLRSNQVAVPTQPTQRATAVSARQFVLEDPHSVRSQTPRKRSAA